MKTCFIFNPTSGRNRRRTGLATDLRDFIESRSLDATVATTEGPGHATQLARDAALSGCTTVVAVGGDGTMNEVAQALLHTPAALALVPCGSGNGLALHLGVPTALLPALNLVALTHGRVALIDTGSANGHPFFNVMGLGLDADVSRRFNTLTSRGLPAYARTALAAFRALRTEPVGLIGAVTLAARLFSGRFDQSAHVCRLRGPSFVIERAAPGLIHTDGETHETGATVGVLVHPRSLRMVVPATSSAVAASDDLAPAGFAFQLP